MAFIDEQCFRVAVIGPAYRSGEILSRRKTWYSPDDQELASITPDTEVHVQISLRVIRKKFYEFAVDPDDVDVVNIVIIMIAMPRDGLDATRLAYYELEALIHDQIPTVIPPKTRFDFTMPLRECNQSTSIAFMFKLVDVDGRTHYEYAGMSRK